MAFSVVGMQGLISGAREYTKLIQQGQEQQLDLHFPYRPQFRYHHIRGHTINDLVQGLQGYIHQHIPTNHKLVLYGNSMGTHVINTLLANTDIYKRLI